MKNANKKNEVKKIIEKRWLSSVISFIITYRCKHSAEHTETPFIIINAFSFLINAALVGLHGQYKAKTLFRYFYYDRKFTR